jgi:hypothetical protein
LQAKFGLKVSERDKEQILAQVQAISVSLNLEWDTLKTQGKV